LKIASQADFRVGAATTNPAAITPGTEFRINIPVKNTGNKDAESVKAILKTKSYFTGTKTDYLGDIEQGSEKIATFELEADRDTIADNYETDIKIMWLDGDERLETTKSFGLVVVSGEGSNTGIVTIAALVLHRERDFFYVTGRKVGWCDLCDHDLGICGCVCWCDPHRHDKGKDC